MVYVTQNLQEAISEGNEGKKWRKTQYNYGHESTSSFKNLQVKKRRGIGSFTTKKVVLHPE